MSVHLITVNLIFSELMFKKLSTKCKIKTVYNITAEHPFKRFELLLCMSSTNGFGRIVNISYFIININFIFILFYFIFPLRPVTLKCLCKAVGCPNEQVYPLTMRATVSFSTECVFLETTKGLTNPMSVKPFEGGQWWSSNLWKVKLNGNWGRGSTKAVLEIGPRRSCQL